jgi:hypothetical protein
VDRGEREMNQKIREHVSKFNEGNGWSVDDDTLIETIRESERVWRGGESGRRWWTDCFTVVTVNGMLIGFGDAITTGDDSPSDKGWEFDPESICEVEAYEVTTTHYKAK